MASFRIPSQPRLLGCGLLVLLVALIAGVTLRDLPRALVERLLARSLDAEVRLAELELFSTGSELRGLLVEDPGIRPEVERFEVETLAIRGSWREMLDGRIDHVTLTGSRLLLQPPEKEAPPPRADLFLGRLEIVDLEVSLPAAESSSDQQAELTVEAELRGPLSALEGQVTARGDFLPFSSFLARSPELPPGLSGGLRQPELRLELGEELTAELHARHLGLQVDVAQGDLSLDVSEPTLDAHLVKEDGRWSTARANVETGSVHAAFAGSASSFTSPWSRWDLDARRDPSNEIRGDLRARWPGLPEARVEIAGSLESQAPSSASLRLLDWRWAETVSGTGATGSLDLELDWQADHLEARATVRPSSVRLPEIRLERLAAELRANGAWSGGEAGLVHIELDLDDARGSMRGQDLPRALFPLRLEMEGIAGVTETPSFDGEARLSHPRAGELRTRGTVTLAPETPRATLSWRWREAEVETLLDLADSLGFQATDAGAVRGLLEGQGTLAGSLEAPRMTAELRLQDVELELPSPSSPTPSVPLLLRLSRLDSRLRWPGFEGEVELLQLRAEGNLPPFSPLPASPFHLETRGSLRPDSKRVALDSIELSLPSLLTASGQLHATRTGKGLLADGSARIDDLDLSRWQEALGLSDVGFAASGTAHFTLPEIHLDGNSWEVDAGLEVDELGLSSPDGGRVLEGLSSRWDARARGGLDGTMLLSGTGSHTGFLVLWDTFFADFSNLSGTWEIEAEQPSQTEMPWSLLLSGSLPDGPHLESRIRIRSGSSHPSIGGFGLRLEIADLAAFYRRYLEGQDVFGNLQLEGAGSLHLDAEAIDPQSWRARGAVTTTDLVWSRVDGDMEVEDLDLELPFDWLHTGGSLSGPRLQGSIAAGRLGFRQLGLSIPATDLWIEGDALGFEDALSLEAFGGAVHLDGLALMDLSLPRRHLTGGLRFEGLDLGILTRRLETLPLEGTLDGFFPRFSLDATELRVDGGGKVDLFGGTVEFRGISGSEIFTPFPRLRLAADFRDLDLLRITRRFDFGEMSGLVSGSVRNAELFRGIPVALGARITTTERRGVPRTVDVKAVNNLSILGTGGGAGLRGNPLDRWFQRFFQRYTYAALGVEVELAGDALLLRGLEKRGGRELFLRGRAPFRIDIVNAQPGRTVSFRAMRRRFEQLDFSAATTVPGG